MQYAKLHIYYQIVHYSWKGWGLAFEFIYYRKITLNLYAATGRIESAKVGRLAKFETFSNLFDFYIIWKPWVREFQNGIIF